LFGLEENGVRLEREFSPCPQFFSLQKEEKTLRKVKMSRLPSLPLKL
jgi:hypothetical protein